MTKPIQPSRPCKGCGATIYRTNTTAPVQWYCGPECRPRCSVDGCDKPRHGRTYCSAHHSRWKRYGDPLAPKLRQSNEGFCSVPDCDQPMRKTGLCASHYAMQSTYGEIRDWNYRWGDGGYVSTHKYVSRVRRKASKHACVDCGERADEWSYNGGDPDEVTDSEGRRFTRNTAAYSPRCVRCHRLFDENPIAMKT